MKDITKKSAKELHEEIAKVATKARETRFGAAGAQSKNTKVLKNMRRSVARMKTVIRAHELADSKKNA
jgi:ribosomal protein L29